MAPDKGGGEGGVGAAPVPRGKLRALHRQEGAPGGGPPSDPNFFWGGWEEKKLSFDSDYPGRVMMLILMLMFVIWL